jgi:hypothetical protein
MSDYVDPSDYLKDLPQIRSELDFAKLQLKRYKALRVVSYPVFIFVLVLHIFLISFVFQLFSDGFGMLAVLGCALYISFSLNAQKHRNWIHRFLVEHFKQDIYEIENTVSELERFISFVEAGKPVPRSYFSISTRAPYGFPF